jgi:hypothetical protein
MGLVGWGQRVLLCSVLSPRDQFVLSEYRLSLMASSRLCTPNVLSRIELEAGNDEVVSCLASSCDIFRPLDCAVFSMSRSLRRKNVVGPDGPGFEVAGGLKVDLLDLSVRASDGAYMLSVGGVVGNENERIGKSELIGGVVVRLRLHLRGMRLERSQGFQGCGFTSVKSERAWKSCKCPERYAGLARRLLVGHALAVC